MSTCASYAETADPADYVTLSEIENFCSIAGPLVVNGASSSTTKLLDPLSPDVTSIYTAPAHTGAVSGWDRSYAVNSGVLRGLSGLLGMVLALL